MRHHGLLSRNRRSYAGAHRSIRYSLASLHEALERAYVARLVATVIHRGFSDEGGVRETRILEQPPKRLLPDGSLPDVLVPVELRPARRLRVVAVPHAHRIESDRRLNLDHGLFVAFVAHYVVPSHVRMAGVQADGDRRMIAQQHHQLGHLVKAAAQRALRSGSVLNQDAEL